MAFGRLERTTGPAPLNEINMTPLIDVMLVLLVIFMITAPMMTSSLKLELPRVEAAASSDTPKFLAVALDEQGRLYLDDELLDEPRFLERLNAAAQKNPQLEVQLRADKVIPYGRVAELMGALQTAGLTRIGFVIEPAAPPPSR
jgi:biopolymer transport protein TolR